MVIDQQIIQSRKALSEKLENTIIYISSKHRLPCKANHEKMVKGFRNLQFYFGSEEMLATAKKTEEFKKKIYYSFQYS
jgi:hypothetical protein